MTDDIIQAAQRLVARSQWKPLLEADFYARIIVDWDGRIAMVNSLAVELFDYPESMMLGHRVEEFMPERFRERHTQHLKRYFEAPTRRSMGTGLELFLLTRSGIEVKVDLGLAPLRVEEGTFASLIVQRKL